MASRRIEISDYDPKWPDQFQSLYNSLWPSVNDIAIAIEHVGSTSVPSLAAKPIIDLDIVIATRKSLPAIVERLSHLGYKHLGNLGIENREAFSRPERNPAHNLYVCIQDGPALRNHLALRDHLRANPTDVARYSVLKRKLAQQYADDIDSYVEGKTEFIVSILAQHGFTADSLSSIQNQNQRRATPEMKSGC